MPFRLLKKKIYKDKSKKNTKERLFHGKYTKREDTARILQEQLRRSASTPNIAQAVLTECDISESYLRDSQIPSYLDENDTVNENAGILMLANRTPSLDHLQQQQQQHADRHVSVHQPGMSPQLQRKTNGNNNLQEHEIITAFRNLQVDSPSCDSCQSSQGKPDVSKLGYRHPPTYQEIAPKHDKKGKPLLEQYRHPPPYRDQHLGSEITSLYPGNIPPEHVGLVYSLMRNYQDSAIYGGMQYFQQRANLPTSASMNFQDVNEQQAKTSQETMTDSYQLYPEGLEGRKITGYAAQAADYPRMPSSTSSGLVNVPSRTSFTLGDQIDYRQPNQIQSSYIQQASNQSDMMSYQHFNMAQDQTAGTQLPAPQLDCPLPPGWEAAYSPEDKIYYIDHNTQTTNWKHPLENEELPDGWEKIDSHQYGVYYVNHATGSSQRDHPAKTQYMQRCQQLHALAYREGAHMEHMYGNNPGVGLAGGKSHDSLSSHPDGLHVNANPYIDAEIPEWLATYARAQSQYDMLLKWELFRYNELDCWQTILKRMYKKEVEQIVMRYEELRQGLQRELERRQKQQKRLSAQAYAEIDKESHV